jgi:hypothetical protein
MSGTAASYRAVGALGEDGDWTVVPAASAAYVTRIVVIRPLDARRFNGTVLIEWLNVSGGLDFPPIWNNARREILRDGSAYVAVSAQKVGVEGGLTPFGMQAKGLKQEDPQRYGALSHPGDAFSYDIFAQAAALLQRRGGAGVLGDLPARRLIGIGESQSAFFLTTYVNAVDPLARGYDGFLIYSRFGHAASLDGSRIGGASAAKFVRLRNDLRVPRLVFETETDVLLQPPLAGFYGARQPDTARLRVWEVPGTAHADAYMFKVGGVDDGTASDAALAAAYAPSKEMFGASLAKAVNDAPQHHYVLEAALAGLERWVATGQAPPHGRPIQLTGSGKPGDPVRAVRDANGNALGGIRTPWLDVPTSCLSGTGNAGSPMAMLLGSAVPFDAAQLAKLYPGGKAEYLRRFTAALDATIKAGFILPADRAEILGVAGISYDAPA